MKAGASYPREIRSDLELVVAALRAGGELPTDVVASAAELPARRAAAALAALLAAGIASKRNQWRGRGKGYAQLWTFAGPGSVSLWEPTHSDGRRRRLYADRAGALEAARKTQGPDADATPVAILVSAEGQVVTGE